MLLLGLATLAGLWAPDVDLALQRWLRHRSVLTHSALLPLLAALLPGEAGPGLAAGLGLGVAVHLACDALSPMRGFALVRPPWPWRGSLRGRSRPWLLANAAGAAAIAIWALPAPHEAWRLIALGVGGVAALLYGALRERSPAAVLMGLAAVAVGAGLGTGLRLGAGLGLGTGLWGA